MSTQFKAGDRVKVHNTTGTFNLKADGTLGTVEKVEDLADIPQENLDEVPVDWATTQALWVTFDDDADPNPAVDALFGPLSTGIVSADLVLA